MIRVHHQLTIDRATEWAKSNSEVKALVIGGSVAKNWATEASDVDAMCIVADEDFERRRKSGKLTWIDTEIASYPGGYVDFKAYGTSFLMEIAKKGGEPMRASFQNAIITYSEIDGLEEIIEEISTYQEHERESKIRSFLAQLYAMEWFAREAEKRDDPYLLTYASQKAVLMAGRLILARNRVFFPFHKWLRKAVAECSLKPDRLLILMDVASRSPSAMAVSEIRRSIESLKGWPELDATWPNQFMEDVEWAWLNGCAPLDER